MLPEKWQIAVTPENREALGKWRDSGSLSADVFGYIVSYDHGTRGYWYKDSQMGYTTICFADFRKYILKENIEPNYEIY